MLYGLIQMPDAVATIQVRMIAGTWGCPTPTARVFYEAGQIYDVPEDLAQCFFSTHAADPAEAHMQDGDAAVATLGAATEAAAPSESTRKARGPRRAKFDAGKGA